MPTPPPYPTSRADRDRWVVSLRGDRNPLDPLRPYAFFAETEPSPSGGPPTPIATVFLTNRECPWRCLMCDLWKNTLPGPTPPGAIPEQIRFALSQLDLPDPSGSAIKLYNAGSFFDAKAVPPSDLPAIAGLVSGFGRVIIECHPALVGPRVLAFADLIPGRLEVAMGLETAHPEILARLNKGMTLDLFRRSSLFLRSSGIDVRTFILVKTPWMTEADGVEWARRSLDFAFSSGSTVCCLIPTRPGNGALDSLSSAGEFSPPTLRSLELSLEYGLSLRLGLVLADTWDLSLFAACPTCRESIVARIRAMNLLQARHPAAPCPACASERLMQPTRLSTD